MASPTSTPTFAENVTFAGSTGTLELADSKTYTGAVTGLSSSGTNSLDLLDIGFAGATTGVYTGTTTSGVLTVTEGANVATIHLTGDYLGSTFTLSNGVGGSTKVVDPAKASMSSSAAAPLSPHPFIAAMAAFDDNQGAHSAAIHSTAPFAHKLSAAIRLANVA